MTLTSYYRCILVIIIVFTIDVTGFSQKSYLSLGDKSYHKYQFDKAIKRYKKAYQIDSSYVALKKLAFAYQANFEIEKTKEYYQLALAHPKAEANLNLAYAEFLAAFRRYSESKKYLEHYLESLPNNAKANLLYNYLIERENYDCNPVLATNEQLFYCVTLDARASIDNNMPHLIYRWNFDDGAELDGLIVNHCFGQSGIHTVALSTVDTISNYQSPTDTVFTLNLSEQLNFNTKGSTIKGAPIAFNAKSLVDITDLYGLLWDLGDGHFEIGPNFEHTYTKQGLYRTRLYVLTKKNDKIEILGCVAKPVFINKSILNIGRK